MQIQLYRDLEEIHAAGFASLKKRQVIYVALAVGIAMSLILILVFILGIPPSIACCPGMLIAFPIAWVGLFQKDGMNLVEYQRLRSMLGKEFTYKTKMFEERSLKNEVQTAKSRNHKNK